MDTVTTATTGSSTFTTTAPNPSTSPTTELTVSDGSVDNATNDQTTIIAAVLGTCLGLLILCIVVFFIVNKRRQQAREAAPTELTTRTVTDTNDAESEISTPAKSTIAPALETEYHSAVPAANLFKALDSTSSDASASRKYHPPPRVVAGVEPDSSASKPTVIRVKSKRKSKRTSDASLATNGSLVRTSARPTAAEVLHIPIGDVVFGKQLGAGAFGVVYKGSWHGKNVAIKQVKASNIVIGNAAIAEFEAEISKMASTTFHENLVQLHGVTTLENGDMAAVVEFCANGSLAHALYGAKARTNWTNEKLFAIAHGAACGVAFLHRLSLIHRDIAARNVLLTKHDEAKVADFGMSRLLSEGASAEQQTATDVGPLKWMAPEQMQRRVYSGASDVFAFGVLLFEIFKREPPWNGISTLMAVSCVVNGERMDVSSPIIPQSMATLMRQCWEADPSARPSMERVQGVLQDNAPNSENASQSDE